MSENIASVSLANSEALRPFLAIDMAGGRSHLETMDALEFLSQYRHHPLPPTPDGRPTGDVYIHDTFDPETEVCALFDHDDTTALNGAARLDRNLSFSSFLRKRRLPHTAEDLDHFMDVLSRLSSPGGNHDQAIMTRMLAQAAFHLAAQRTLYTKSSPKAVPFGQDDSRKVMAQIQDVFTSFCNTPPNEEQPFYYNADGIFITTSVFDKQGGSLLQLIYRHVTWPLFHQTNTAVSEARHILHDKYNIPVGILSKGSRDTQLLRIANAVVDHEGSIPPGVIIITPGNKGDAVESAIQQGIFANPNLRLVHLDDNIEHINSLQAAYVRLRTNGSHIRFSPLYVPMEASSTRYSHPVCQGLAELALVHHLKTAPRTPAPVNGIPAIDNMYYDGPTIAEKVLYMLRDMRLPEASI